MVAAGTGVTAVKMEGISAVGSVGLGDGWDMRTKAASGQTPRFQPSAGPMW